MISIQLLAIAYSVMGALLLYLLIATRRSLTFKILTIVLVSTLYVGTYVGLKHLQGWPVSEALPLNFRLHWALINEPDKALKQQGTIDLWVQQTSLTGQVTDKPRAYRLPYELDLAEQVQDALQQIGEGHIVEGQLDQRTMADETETNKQEEVVDASDNNTNVDNFKEKEAGLEFTTLQRSSLPPKGS